MGNYTITVTTPDRTMTVAEAEAELKRLLNQEVRILTAETPCPHDYYYFDTDVLLQLLDEHQALKAAQNRWRCAWCGWEGPEGEMVKHVKACGARERLEAGD